MIAVGISVAGGCNRAWYRRQADREVYHLVGEVSSDPRWPLNDFTIEPDPQSRFYHPDSADCPPLPPDDPVSHQLMHCVHGKRGYHCWHCNGDTPHVESPGWKAYLALNEEGELIIDRVAAVELSLTHSREFQRSLEELYLSALSVTFERFRFDTQFFGGNRTSFTATGPLRGGQSTLATDTDLQMRRLGATGTQYLVEIANSMVWQFAGPDQFSTVSVLDFSIFQPLLRLGGRAVVLEALTQSERNLLANVRQMERFRRGFYAQIVAGRSAGPGPVRGGVGMPAPTSAEGPVGGIMALLEEQVQIRNQEFNVAGLRDSLAQLEAFNAAGRIDVLQVDQARQALLTAQSRLLASRTRYQSRLDAFKITLGLPPDLPVQISDPYLDRFDLIDPAATALQDRMEPVLNRLRDRTLVEDADEFRRALDELEMLLDAPEERFEAVTEDLRRLDEALPERRANLELLARRERRHGDVDIVAFELATLDERVAALHTDVETVRAGVERLVQQLEILLAEGPPEDLPPVEDGPLAVAPLIQYQDRVLAAASDLASWLLELSLLQALVRLESVTLVPVDMDAADAIEVARRERLDWMNARAALVDQWRQIEVVANRLKSDLNLTFSGDIQTVGDNPAAFRSSAGRLRVGLEFDAPLTRLQERNVYRTTLIDYQRTRRDYYLFEDRVQQSLRQILRTIELNQLNFELNRAAVRSAIAQVDFTRLRLEQPPRVGAVQQQLGATTARDLLGAYSGLLSAQNDFLSVWVDYEVQRMILDFELGTMQLDNHGLWLDPGPLQGEELRTAPAAADPESSDPRLLPPPLPLELQGALEEL